VLSYIGSISQSETTNTVIDTGSTSATTTTTTVTEVTCKHGPLECAGNTQQLCFKEFFPDHEVWVPFVTTMNSWQPRRIGEPRYAREVAEKVLALRRRQLRGLQPHHQHQLDEKEAELLDKVDECARGQQGFDLLVESVQNTLDHGIR